MRYGMSDKSRRCCIATSSFAENNIPTRIAMTPSPNGFPGKDICVAPNVIL
jgi:hypothetical protein